MELATQAKEMLPRCSSKAWLAVRHLHTNQRHISARTQCLFQVYDVASRTEPELQPKYRNS